MLPVLLIVRLDIHPIVTIKLKLLVNGVNDIVVRLPKPESSKSISHAHASQFPFRYVYVVFCFLSFCAVWAAEKNTVKLPRRNRGSACVAELSSDSIRMPDSVDVFYFFSSPKHSHTVCHSYISTGANVRIEF